MSIYENCPMFILSNRIRSYGASSIFCPAVMRDFADMCGCEKVVMLPSSIHEWMLMPLTDGFDFNEAEETIHEVNEYVIGKNEVLSDHVYIYDREIDKITM
jgi:hypothetical protein